MFRTVRPRIAALAVLVAALTPVLLLGSRPLAEAAELGADPQSSALAAHPCGQASSHPGPIRHVVWIWMENHSYSQVIGSEDAPYVNALAGACGLATDYHAIGHPSLPNYLAATGGSTFGVRGDQLPPGRVIHSPSIFSEVAASGRQWRTYVESMSGNCRATGAHGFGRNPVKYYAAEQKLCGRWDVPLGTPQAGPLASALRAGRLPAFSLVIPNLCDSSHSCPPPAGDAWLSRWLNAIVTSRAYRKGDTAVFLTWDEGRRPLSQHVPMLVISPGTTPGSRSAAPYNHYSLLRTTADLLRVAPPGRAATASPLGAAFGLGSGGR